MTATRTQKRKSRGNGDGSIYQTSRDGRWHAAIAWTDRDGHLRRKEVSGTSRAEVSKRLTALKAGLDKGQAPTPSMPIADFLGHAERTVDGTVEPPTGWLRDQLPPKVRPATYRVREQMVRLYIIPALGKKKLDRLTFTDVETMTRDMLARGLSPRTASHARATLRTALNAAKRARLVHENAASEAEPPTIGAPERRYIRPADLRRFLAACHDHPMGELMTLATLSGMRQGECLGLAWDAIDWTTGQLEVRQQLGRTLTGYALVSTTKTPKSRRTIDLAPTAIAALERRRERQEADEAKAGDAWQNGRDRLVFTDTLGRPLRGHAANEALHAILEGAGMEPVSFHSLRHSASTAWLAAGVPLHDVSKLLGHSSITLTSDLYGHLVPESRSAAAAAMERMVSG